MTTRWRANRGSPCGLSYAKLSGLKIQPINTNTLIRFEGSETRERQRIADYRRAGMSRSKRWAPTLRWMMI